MRRSQLEKAELITHNNKQKTEKQVTLQQSCVQVQNKYVRIRQHASTFLCY